MLVDSNASFCERCGRRYALHPPRPDARDLGLTGVRSTFRYCSTCGQFVGRSCCWNAEAVACTVCEPDVAPARPPRLSAAGAGRRRERAARIALDELTAAIESLHRVAQVAVPGVAPSGASARRVWEEAWWATGWLVIRAESSRDAISKHVWSEARAPTARTAAGARAAKSTAVVSPTIQALSVDFEGALAEYQATLNTVTAALLDPAHRRALRGDAVIDPRAGRRPWGRRLLPTVLVGIAVVGAGAAAAAAGLVGDGRFGTVTATDPATERGEILGGASTPRPTPDAPAPITTHLTFDTLRMGPLREGSDITALAGSPEIVSYPSAFDRSIRMAGGTQGFCVSPGGLRAGPITVSLDLYREAMPTAGRIELTAPGSSAGGVAVVMPFSSLDVERWYRASIVVDDAGAAALELRDLADNAVVGSEDLLTRTASGAQAGSICLAVLGTEPNAGILVDNFVVQQ